MNIEYSTPQIWGFLSLHPLFAFQSAGIYVYSFCCTAAGFKICLVCNLAVSGLKAFKKVSLGTYNVKSTS